jgi:hypothetical protein
MLSGRFAFENADYRGLETRIKRSFQNELWNLQNELWKSIEEIIERRRFQVNED